jgi:hypothetical protein
LPPQPGDDQNRRLARVVGQLGQAVSPYTLRKYGAPGAIVCINRNWIARHCQMVLVQDELARGVEAEGWLDCQGA